MALNIDWRFAGPQDINVPQSNFLNSLDKNIQKGLEIKKEFDKKRDDNEMIRLMTEESENKLKDLYKQESELINKINSLSEDEYIANKTYYDDALKKIDEQINLARKEVTDAKMNANQFKTTGTTDFFRWKKDKEYASEVANINREMLNQQTKNEKLSNLYYEIKAKEQEYDRSADTDKQIELTDEINLLRERYNKISGENHYPVFVGTQKNKVKQNVDGAPKGEDTPKADGGIKTPDWIKTAIKNLKWEENLKDSVAVKEIQVEIDKQTPNNKNNLSQELDIKIEELNNAKVEKDKGAAAAARKARDEATDKLDDLILNKNLNEISKFYYDSKNKNYSDLLDNASNYLLKFLSGVKLGAANRGIDRHKALLAIYGPNGSNPIPALATFIEKNVNAINGVKQVKN